MTQGQTGAELLSATSRSLDGAGTRGEQLVARLRSLVGDLNPGAELPSERVIAEHFGIARMTAREAVDRLVEQGLAERIARRGTFATQPRFVHTRHLASYDDDIRARGMVPGGRKISARVRTAARPVAEALGIEAGARYLDLVRLRTADGEPMAIIRSQIAIDRFPGIERLELDHGSLHGVLFRRWGVRAASHLQRIRAVLVQPADAELLEVSAGVAGFEILGVSHDGNGAVIESGRSVYRADRYEVVLHTDLPAAAAPADDPGPAAE
ncbi:GntR family transcriptional regulator [Microlunatus speluncae]|uniref:GntR family transcriptional regulator n=1 Tax=Microlunatus speluncae TaxID=2594267 RepID=UPI0012666701|nr:GntR family transcriptional regulator [Microlunatus speluncae]